MHITTASVRRHGQATPCMHTKQPLPLRCWAEGCSTFVIARRHPLVSHISFPPFIFLPPVFNSPAITQNAVINIYALRRALHTAHPLKQTIIVVHVCRVVHTKRSQIAELVEGRVCRCSFRFIADFGLRTRGDYALMTMSSAHLSLLSVLSFFF